MVQISEETQVAEGNHSKRKRRERDSNGAWKNGKVKHMPPTIDLTFPHTWQARVLPARPLILPARQFVYPARAEEVERGALELLVTPPPPSLSANPSPAPSPGTPPNLPPSAQDFLATCALGFADPAAPTGLWSCPHPDQLCALSGGYAYLVDARQPDRFTFLRMRPVLTVLPAPEAGILLFAGHRTVLAWARDGLAWETEKLSDEGLTLTSIDGPILRGLGWEMLRDRESEFAVDLATGRRL